MNCLNRLRGAFDRLSLRSKIFAVVAANASFILLIALAGLKCSFSAYNSQLYRAVAGNLSFSSQTIADSLKSIEALSSVAIASSMVQESLDAVDISEDSLDWSQTSRILSNVISGYQEAYKSDGVSAIALYNRHFRNVTNFSVVNGADPATLEQALEAGRAREGAISWTVSYEKGLCLVVRNIRKIENLELTYLGDLVIFVDMPRIVEDANRAMDTYGVSDYILYDGEELIYTSQGLEREDAAFFRESAVQPYCILRREGHSYFAVKNQIPGYGWTYINLVPYDRIVRSVDTACRLVLAMLALGLAVTLFFAQRLTRYALKDFDLLIEKMDYFSGSELEVPQLGVDYSGRNDEVSRLHRHFDAMATHIRDLVQKNYVNQILNREARLKALEAQINPHFLYNTLDAIHWRARSLNDRQIPQMVEALSALLRATLSNKSPLVTLAYEIDLARCYMTIQKIRFEERLVFDIQYNEDLLDALILPLAIQPLLENAVRYGMEETTGTCEIGIRAFRREALLIVEVSNEGSVFEEDLLEKLERGEKRSGGFGIGLVNIHQRIRLVFGESYGLSFENRKGRAVAVITIPYTIEERDYVKPDYCG